MVVFCGVNGVGKSTNLAKIAYWLGQHNIKVSAPVAVCWGRGQAPKVGVHGQGVSSIGAARC